MANTGSALFSVNFPGPDCQFPFYLSVKENVESMDEKLATLKRITFTQAEALAAEKGVQLICESERVFRKCGRYTNTITNSCYKISTLPDKKFYLLTDVRDFLLKGETRMG